MRDAGSLARGRDDVGRLRTEHAIQNFIRGYCERDDQPDRRTFIADAEGRDVEFRHDVVDRLFGQLGQVPLGQVVPDLPNGVHKPKVAGSGSDGIGCFPTGWRPDRYDRSRQLGSWMSATRARWSESLMPSVRTAVAGQQQARMGSTANTGGRQMSAGCVRVNAAPD